MSAAERRAEYDRKREAAKAGRQAERDAGRSGINNANTNGSRIPNAKDRQQEDAVRAQAEDVADATRAGYAPGGTAPATGNVLNQRQNLFASMEKDGVTPEARKQARSLGVTDQSFNAAAVRAAANSAVYTKPPATTTTPAAASKPSWGSDGNSIPDKIQLGGPTAGKPRPFTGPASELVDQGLAPAPAAKPVSMIDGKPASEVLSGMRGEAKARGESPFEAGKEERNTAAQWAASEKAKADALAASRPKPGVTDPPKPAVTATPSVTPSPTEPAAPAPGAEPAPIATPTAAPKGTPLGTYYDAMATTTAAATTPLLGLAAAGNMATRSTDKLVRGATSAFTEATDMTNMANRALRRVGSIEHGLKRVTGDLLPRQQEALTKASKLASNAKLNHIESKVLSQGMDGFDRVAKFGRKAYETEQKFQDVASGVKRGTTGVARITEKLGNAKTVATELSDDALRLTAKSDKLMAAASKSAGRTALKATGKLVSKVAVPLEVAMMGVEGARLLDSDHRAARAKEFEQYANEGAAGSALQSALNPVAGIYSGAHQIGKLSQSSADAAAAGQAAGAAQKGFDVRQALLAKEGHTRESLAKLSQKDRSAILRGVRERTR